jgi:hypothetical protein
MENAKYHAIKAKDRFQAGAKGPEAVEFFHGFSVEAAQGCFLQDSHRHAPIWTEA